MLQTISDKLKGQRWLAATVLGLLALIFAVWGAYGIVNISFGPANYGLKVNGEAISAETLNRAWLQRQSELEQSSGEITDAQKTALQAQLMDEYAQQTLLRQLAVKDGYTASNDQVQAALASEPAFQVDGKYNPTVAKAMLAQAGIDADSYVADRRQELGIAQLAQGVQLSDFLTPTELNHIYALENEQRELRYALLPADRFAAAVPVDDKKVDAWYQAHQADYMNPESVRLQYAELTLDAIAASIKVTDADLQAFYDKNKSRYVENEKRHAHHILIAVATPNDPKADADALAKAKDVEAQLKAGKDFGELARKYSADPGSAKQGGDLGWAEKTAYVGAFADALFSMQAGQVSDPVKTQFGYHIIRLDEIRPQHDQTLVEARAQIEAEYRREQATSLFGDRQEQLQQKLENGGAGSDLSALAMEFGLTTGEAKDFTRNGGPPLGNKPDLIHAVFSDEALSGSRVGGPVALADDRIAVFKVLEHHAPAVKPLAEVRTEVAAAIRRSEGSQAAKKAADDAVKALNAGSTFDAAAKTLGVTAAPAASFGRGDPQLPASVRETAFAAPAPADNKPVYRAVSTDNGGAAILAVLAVHPGKGGANPKNDEQLIAQYNKRHREGELSAYIQELQRSATIQKNPSAFQ
jgi:peptidyl-prolyl cis-trans isomerase D